MAAPAPKLSASVSMRFAKSLSAPLEQGGDRRGDPELGPRNARKARLAVPYLWGTPRPRDRDRRRPTAGSVSQVHQGGGTADSRNDDPPADDDRGFGCRVLSPLSRELT